MNSSRRRCWRSVRSRKSRYLRGICPITVMSPCHEFIAEDCATCSVLVRDSLCAMHTSGGWRIASERPSEIRRLGFAARSRSPAGQSERIAPLVKTSGCHRGWRPERGPANCLPARPHAPSSQDGRAGRLPRVVRSCSARSPVALCREQSDRRPRRAVRNLGRVDRWELRMPGCFGEWDRHRYGRSSRRSSSQARGVWRRSRKNAAEDRRDGLSPRLRASRVRGRATL
jgi:hypothetical protein